VNSTGENQGRASAEDQARALARLEERESIAMELHDNIIQSLHGAVLSLRAIERSGELNAEQVRLAVRDVRCQLDATIRELRRFVLDVAPRATRRYSLSAKLRRIANQASLTEQVRVKIDLDETADLALTSVRLVDQLAAIAREATSNALRHAGASTLAIRLSHEGGRIVLVISDDGGGLGAAGSSRSLGRGLNNMARRARVMGAQVKVHSELGAGTEVRVELPVEGDPTD
jgi:signal transduction histidine kinase